MFIQHLIEILQKVSPKKHLQIFFIFVPKAIWQVNSFSIYDGESAAATTGKPLARKSQGRGKPSHKSHMRDKRAMAGEFCLDHKVS